MQDATLAEPEAPAPAESDALLVQAAVRNPTAFAVLYHRYIASVHRYIYSRVSDRACAEDLTAEVFTRALKALPAYREQGTFAAWLFSIVRRTVADHYRGSRSVLPLDAAGDVGCVRPDPLAQALEHEALAELTERLARLDEDQREMLRLRYAAGLTYREIGQVLGKREAAVKMAVHRLLGRLHAEWEDGHAR